MNFNGQASQLSLEQEATCYYEEEKILNLRREFESLSVPKRIERAYKEFGVNLIMTTAFGYGGIVLISFVKDTIPDLPIYFIDTGYHFKETLQLADKLEKDWDLNLIRLNPEFTEEELEEILGKEAYKKNIDQCCYYRKVRPLQTILKPETVWLSSVRRDQAQLKSRRHVVAIDGRGNVKINPICDWTRNQVWTYIKKYNLPYNPLHDQGYPSIGCEPCTSPVLNSDDERSGRWKGSNKVECGLHTYRH